MWSIYFIGLENCFQYKPGLDRIQFMVGEDRCKGSWGNMGVVRVFIYVAQKHKCAGPL